MPKHKSIQDFFGGSKSDKTQSLESESESQNSDGNTTNSEKRAKLESTDSRASYKPFSAITMMMAKQVQKWLKKFPDG